MSGTAMDGIDAALIETDGHGYINWIGFETESHDPDFREMLRSCLNKPDRNLAVEKEFTLRQVPVIKKLLQRTGLNASDIDVIGFHGQTTHHDPDRGVTLQLGDGQLLAEETGIDVVYDLRSNDMRNGGQGAPLLPVYHRALAKNAALSFPIVVLNLGGVANITWIGENPNDMIAFDTGPANAMIDDWVKAHTDQTYDKNGKIAAAGTIDQSIVDTFLSHEYFAKPYPKSLDRNDFATITVDGLSLENGAATLTEMTVLSVAKGVALCPQQPAAIYVTGGGRHNGYMMERLSELTGVPVHSVDTLGWNGDSMEAEGFAYMAVRSLLNEPISFPGTTGCASPTIGGIHVQPKARAA